MSDKQVQEAVQAAQQAVQQANEAIQALQASQQTAGSQANEKRVSTSELHDVGVDENQALAGLSMTRQWNFNDKALVEKSQDYDRALKALEIKEKELLISQKESDQAHKRKLESVEIMERQNAAILTHMINVNSVNFSVAAQHPYSPNGASEAKESKR